MCFTNPVTLWYLFGGRWNRGIKICWICQGGTEAGDAGSFRETLEAADEETGADEDGDDADEEDDDDDDDQDDDDGIHPK